MERDSIVRKANEKSSAVFSPGKIDAKPLEVKGREVVGEEGSPLTSPLFLELMHRIEITLSSIKSVTQLSQGKFKDPEFEDYFHGSVTKDIEKIESVINGLLNYVKISTPILKSNTVHFLLEETVEKFRNQIEEKNIRLLKRFEKGLPETVVHEEQLRYVFASVLQYVIAAIPPAGNIGLLTKVPDHQKTAGDKKGPSARDDRYVEVVFGFTGYKKPSAPFRTELMNTAPQRDEATDLILRLVKEII